MDYRQTSGIRSGFCAHESPSCSLIGTLGLIDLRSDRRVRIGAPSTVAHDGNHSAGRALLAAGHADVPEAAGIAFASRFTGGTCIAVFDRAFGKFKLLGVDELVHDVGFLDALDDYETTLTEPPE